MRPGDSHQVKGHDVKEKRSGRHQKTVFYKVLSCFTKFCGVISVIAELRIESIAIGRKLPPLPPVIASPATYDRITAAWRDAKWSLLELREAGFRAELDRRKISEGG